MGGEAVDGCELDHLVDPPGLDKTAIDPEKMIPGTTTQMFQESPQNTGQNISNRRAGTNVYRGGGAPAGHPDAPHRGLVGHRVGRDA